jgi:hypothetical protein
VTDWQVVFLGIMAVALAVMATMQIVTALALLKATREISGAIREIQRDIKPLIDKTTRMADDAARVTALALAQIERVDSVVATLASRIEETAGIVQNAVVQPMKHGATLVAAFRAVFAAVREWQGRQAAARDDEDPLFVG